jgi:hypothetical protein
MALTWKSNFSGNECRIFRGKLIVGILKSSSWNNDGYGELNGHLVKFRTKGVIKRITEILDIEGVKQLGQIKYNLWKGSAQISYGEQDYEWKFGSWTRRKWSVQNVEAAAEFKLTSFWKNEGDIENEDVSAAIILSALFVHTYFRKLSAAS